LVHLIKLAPNTGLGLQLWKPQNAIHFLSHGKDFSNCRKTGRNSAV